MKSLEIVNEILKNEEDIQIVTRFYYLMTKGQLEQIKQDLEVLEILRRVCFKKYEMFNCVSDYGLIDRGFWISDSSHECVEFELDNEDYNKLKQWLEENE